MKADRSAHAHARFVVVSGQQTRCRKRRKLPQRKRSTEECGDQQCREAPTGQGGIMKWDVRHGVLPGMALKRDRTALQLRVRAGAAAVKSGRRAEPQVLRGAWRWLCRAFSGDTDTVPRENVKFGRPVKFRTRRGFRSSSPRAGTGKGRTSSRSPPLGLGIQRLRVARPAPLGGPPPPRGPATPRSHRAGGGPERREIVD